MPTAPEPPSPDNGASAPSMLGGLSPDELFARGMQSVRMTGGGSMQNWEPPTVEEASRLFPNYKVVDVLGRGGMGAVYKAVQTALDRVVAVKLLPLEISIDRDFADRFVREARTMAKLNHPNIVSVFDFGTTTEGHLYFVMEFVEGTTLHHLIKSTGLKPTHALELIVCVCEALQYAHGEGVVHRDIKPANVLVDTKGRVKVADFGLARMDSPSAEQWGQTMTGMVLGTPDYMAPEQKNGARVDHRADIYSLGVMLYEMLCGQIPQGIFDPPSQRVQVDERVDQVVIRAMQQEPDRRYSNTGEMKSDVEIIRHTPVPKGEPPAPPGGRKIPAPPGLPRGVPKAPSLVTTEADAALQVETVVQAASAVQMASAVQAAREKSAMPWLAGIAALCALVAVCVVIIQMMRPATPAAGPVVPPTAPELAPIKSATPAPAVETAAEKAGTAPAKKESPAPSAEPVVAKTEPAAPPASATAKADPVGEPPAPVPSPPSEPPVAVATLPGTSRIAQIVPPPTATSSLEPVAPVPVASASSAPPAAAAAPEPDAPAAEGDWHIYLSQGDQFMQRRQRDEAMDAYLSAFDLASDGRPISAAEITQLCKKVSSLQMSFGSLAEARQTLEKGRASLKRMAAGKDGGDRQKYLEQIENLLRGLPRD